jgi:hypothetical protein
MNFNIDPVDDVFDLFEVKTHLLTPECDCFTDLKIMILRSDKINIQKKIELENSIKLYGGTTTSNIGKLKKYIFLFPPNLKIKAYF